MDYYFARMQGTGALRQKQQDEQREKYAEEHDVGGAGGEFNPGMEDRPDGIPEDVWRHMPADQRKRQLSGHGGVNVDAYEDHLDIWDDIEDERG